jgi:hypothetical protein
MTINSRMTVDIRGRIARQGLNSEAREGIGAFLGKRRPQSPMGES